MEEKTILWIILALVALQILAGMFTKRNSYGSVEFSVPKFNFKKDTTDNGTQSV